MQYLTIWYPKMSEWIDCNKIPAPKNGDKILVVYDEFVHYKTTPTRDVGVCCYANITSWNNEGFYLYEENSSLGSIVPLYWMPIPEIPND